jgi:hypothetical protein
MQTFSRVSFARASDASCARTHVDRYRRVFLRDHKRPKQETYFARGAARERYCGVKETLQVAPRLKFPAMRADIMHTGRTGNFWKFEYLTLYELNCSHVCHASLPVFHPRKYAAVYRRVHEIADRRDCNVSSSVIMNNVELACIDSSLESQERSYRGISLFAQVAIHTAGRYFRICPFRVLHFA